ncbi:MAG: CAP domain-containing protein, partial [Pseudomonadota bacterium]
CVARIMREPTDAQQCLRIGRLTHNAGDTTLQSRLRSVGYPYRLAAENIAMQSRSDPTELPHLFVEAWLGSAGHRRNILNPGLRDIGVGTAAGGRTTYAVQVFGTPG